MKSLEAQAKGRGELFRHYGALIRDYEMSDRAEASADSEVRQINSNNGDRMELILLSIHRPQLFRMLPCCTARSANSLRCSPPRGYPLARPLLIH